ncbi:MAG: glycosyltransferase family 4 protein [Solirubrobacterales bacterium]|nr:glycosyltransferase family 4 protein [Solirubrobacterales bacterium]
MGDAADEPRLRVLLGPTDPAGVAHNLGQGLRELGHSTETVVWEPSPFGYAHDRVIESVPERLRFALGAGRRHDVVHAFGGRSLVPYLDLVAARLRRRSTIVQYNGTDARDSAIAAELHPARARIVDPARDRNIRAHRRAAGLIARSAAVQDLELVSYLLGSYRTIYVIPFAIDLPTIDAIDRPDAPAQSGKPLRVLHAPSNRRVKGSDLIDAAIAAAGEEAAIEPVTVHGMPHEQTLAAVAHADVVVDQLNSETPGVLAAEGMALGKPVLVEMDERKLAPFARPTPAVAIDRDTLAARLVALAHDPAERARLGAAGRSYARAVHSPLGAARAATAAYHHSRTGTPGVFQVTPDGAIVQLNPSDLAHVTPSGAQRS